jgi:hypothetical protein
MAGSSHLQGMDLKRTASSKDDGYEEAPAPNPNHSSIFYQLMQPQLLLKFWRF